MKPIYLYDVGIKPWEQSEALCDSSFATITVVHRSISDLLGLWLILAAAISHKLPRVLKWRTVGHSIEGSKVQELKLVRQLQSDLSAEDYLEKNTTSNIYSYMKRMSVKEIDLSSISQPRYTVLTFLPEDGPKSNLIWEMFKNSDEGLDAKGIEVPFRSCSELVICRLTESDTHVGLQFIGMVEQLDPLLERLSELEIDRAEDKDVAQLMNS